MVRQSAIQRKRDDVRFEIEQTERGLQELLSLNESILLEITEMESDFVLSDAMDTGTNSDASLSAAASFSSSEELRSVNVINGTVNRSSSPETLPVDSWLSQFWPESSQVSDDWSDLLDRLRTLRSDHFRMNYSLIQALHDHLEMLLRKEEELAAQRYANRAKRYAGRGPGHGLMRCLDHVDRNDRDHDFFLTDIRMSKKAFDELYKVIKDHAVFKSRGRKPQTSPRIQLAVALWRFGGYGNRASAKGAVQWSGYSIGSVLKFTDRVMVALNEPIGGPMRTTTRRGTSKRARDDDYSDLVRPRHSQQTPVTQPRSQWSKLVQSQGEYMVAKSRIVEARAARDAERRAIRDRAQTAKYEEARRSACDKRHITRNTFYFEIVCNWPEERQAQFRLHTDVDRFLGGEEDYIIARAQE
ncbi:BQ5605_C001g00089 [Microbotryum silenes-dioicae]|uniref:BQ5605_C001g00089 protein n=1 Tax=Microbotryum silenes-dioicae TaxID=796604 RepID=A0A2X0M5S7_9BASI|nr:BQ5605_C001g00089 [Microbotryum silenes-dioicae]